MSMYKFVLYILKYFIVALDKSTFFIAAYFDVGQ